jgi:hypothetical protein
VRVDQHLFTAFAIASVVTASISSGGCGNSSSGTGLGPSALGSSGGSSGGAGTFGSDDDSGTSSGSLGGGGSGGTITSGVSTDASGAAPTCSSGTGWQCSVDKSCSTSSPTTLTGKVYDPAGLNPLYNALVFIPNVVADLPTITPGTNKCNACDASVGDYVAIAQTKDDGSFTLTNVPTGTDVPVTVQMGKWRRTVTVSTRSCSTTTVAAGTLRLPKTHMEGDMPQMALLTGGCDDMACFLTGIGIDDSEFTAPHAGGRVDVYQGVGLGGLPSGATLSNGTAGNCTTNACPLWQSKASFEYYDLALFSCECGEQTNTNETTNGYTYLSQWLNEGGKVFASHFNYTWFNNTEGGFQNVATWLGTSIAGSATGPFAVNNPASFPKGVTYAEWLQNVGAITSLGPPAPINLTNVASSVSTVNAQTTQEWIYQTGGGDGAAGDVKYLSFDTPIGGLPPAADAGESSTKNYCGKAVFTDLHTGGELLAQYNPVPSKCPTGAKLSAQQAAIEFLFFDLSACVADDSQPPPPPPPPPPQ